MVNSRDCFESQQRNEAARRLRYSHPVVMDRCRNTKEAWLETTKQAKHNLNIGFSITRPEVRNTISTQSVRMKIRKSPLRGLFCGGSRALSCGDASSFAHEHLDRSHNEKIDTDIKYLKASKCFPEIRKTQTRYKDLQTYQE